MMTATSAVCFNAAAAADTNNGGDIKAVKRILRRQILTARNTMSAAARQTAAADICRQILQLPDFNNARCLAAFAPMEYEVDIWPLLEECRWQNKTVALPRIGNLRRLSFHALGARDLLQAGAKNIMQPPAKWRLIHPSQFDFLLIPAVAIDRQNYRLGYGGGFYDTFMTCLNCVSCAPVFRCQRTAQVPTEAHDRQVDFVFSE